MFFCIRKRTIILSPFKKAAGLPENKARYAGNFSEKKLKNPPKMIDFFEKLW